MEFLIFVALVNLVIVGGAVLLVLLSGLLSGAAARRGADGRTKGDALE